MNLEILNRKYNSGEVIKEERCIGKMKQEQLRIGAKKSFISRIENGLTDIQLSILYRLI